jgi:hypothetical protein
MPRNTVALYSSGTGGAGVFGSAAFLLLNVVAKLPPSTILYICSPVPMFMAILYVSRLNFTPPCSFASYFLVLTEGNATPELQLITNGVMDPHAPETVNGTK